MSPEIIYGVATVAGGVAGYGFEQVALHRAAKQPEENHYPALQAAVQTEVAETSQAPKSGLMRNISRTAMRAVLPLAVATFAGLEAYSFTPVSTPQKKASVELVVDDSGATQNVAGQIREVVREFNHTGAEAYVGNTGTVTRMPAENYEQFSTTIKGAPAGEAPLNQQVSLALNSVAESNNKKQATGGDVVVITNGNSLGDTKSLAAQANEQRTPLYVVNVERAGTPASLIGQLRTMTTATHGRFWSANGQNLATVSQDVKATTSPNQAATPSPDRWPDRISGLFALLAGGIVFNGRRRLPTGKDVKGE